MQNMFVNNCVNKVYVCALHESLCRVLCDADRSRYMATVPLSHKLKINPKPNPVWQAASDTNLLYINLKEQISSAQKANIYTCVCIHIYYI